MSKSCFLAVVLFFAIFLGFFSLYTYSQIDLNLTLSSNIQYQNLQQQLIFLGYFNRPLSAVVYIGFLLLFFSFFLYLVKLAQSSRIHIRQIIVLIAVSVCILFFSYPSFSHDIFNYMFDGRIVTYYNMNPYVLKANDFPNDLWIRFMHWTHRTYPYGPLWLTVSLPFSYLGFGKFVGTLWLFKFLFLIAHVGNVYLIYKIAEIFNTKMRNYMIVFYAFNPLILIESLVSPHNEVVMLFFLLLAFYFLLSGKKYYLSLVCLFASFLIKFVSLIVLPVFIWSKVQRRSAKFLLSISFTLLLIGVGIEAFYKELYPWYFVMPLGIGVLVSQNKYIATLLFLLSFGLLMRYIPFLYEGEYTQKGRMFQDTFSLLPFLFLLIYIGVDYLYARLREKNFKYNSRENAI